MPAPLHLRLLLLLACALATTRALAEVHAACCRCASWYVLSEEGFGFARHHVGFCPKCTGEMGGSPEAYVDKLGGRHQGLADAAQLTLARFREAEAARDKARDSIYGRKGLATGFFTSLINLASEGAGKTFKSVAKAVKDGLKRYNQAADTAQGDFGWVLDEGKGWVKKNTVGAAQDKAKLKAAAAIGRNYYARTKDARGATDQFLKAHGDIKKGVSILEGAINFHEKTSKLADGIQDYLEHRADAKRLYEEWDAITNDMQKIDDEKKKIEKCLELMKEQGKSASFPAAARGWVPRFAQGEALAEERKRLKARAYPSDEPNESALLSAVGALRLVESDLAELTRHLETEFIPPLLPFWLDVQEDLGPELSIALLEWADPAAEKASRVFDRTHRRAEGAADQIRSTMPRE